MNNINRIANPAYVQTMKYLVEGKYVSKKQMLAEIETKSVWFDTNYAKAGIDNAYEDWRNEE